MTDTNMNNASQPVNPAAPATPAPAAAPVPAAAAAPVAGGAKPIIQYDDFAKLDLRVAKVLEAAPHPNADKLLVLKVDLGTEQRQIIAGIRAWYTPESIIGKSVVVVANLAPRKMRGLESNGMLLAGSTGAEPDRTVVAIMPEKDLPPGSPVS